MTTDLGSFAETIFARTYAFTEGETWEQCSDRVATFVANGDKELAKQFFDVISKRKFIPGGRYLYGCGREIPQLTNCFLLKAEDSREGWGKLLAKHVNALSLGGGVGTEYTDIRASGRPIKRYGGVASGPLSLMQMVNEVARHVMAGGKRRSALWAGLAWHHPDIQAFIKAKNWSTQVKACKEADFNFPATLDMTNISVRLDDTFFKAVKENDDVWKMYYEVCKSMCKTGEPGFSIDVGENSDDILRNPCTEVVSSTDSDSCNLGSINLGRIDSLEELEDVTRIAVRFLYCGTFASWLPHDDFYNIRERNRRIGLGLMGVHEWCLRRGLPYEPSGKLGRWLTTWQGVSDDEATKYAKLRGDVRPVAVRAIAPTGTIGIIGETTTGIEPVFCVAYKRRFLDSDGKWKFSYVIDPTVERLVSEHGVDPDTVEDARSLSTNVEKRISMQAFVQDFVDQAISSTINLPEWGENGNNNAKRFAETLLKYLPRLRGITVYPDGARAGQPITSIKYATAKKHKGVVYEESADRCSGGACGV
jgi:ribonucleoside-diphosphate reductase alpha chain